MQVNVGEKFQMTSSLKLPSECASYENWRSLLGYSISKECI